MKDGVGWVLDNKESGIRLQANPFFEGEYYIPVDSWDIEEKLKDDMVREDWYLDIGSPPLPPYEEFRKSYMEM